MGQRSASESIIAILQAFLAQRTWQQSELASHVGLRVPALRARLDELGRAGVPLDREEDHPHVYWSVPARWFPGAVTLAAADAQEVLRQLGRAPSSPERDRLLIDLAKAAGAGAPIEGVSAPIFSDGEATHLRAIEDGLRARATLRLKYHSASRGHVDPRDVSVQCVFPGAHTRFVAVCHRDGALKYFRLSRVQEVSPVPEVPFRAASDDELAAFVAQSIDGYRDPGTPIVVRFTVRDPQARWVKDSLSFEATSTPCPGGLRFEATTAAVTSLARHLVGLGEAATAETPELVAAIVHLARGALRAHDPRPQEPHVRSVVPIRSTESDANSA